MHGYIYDVFLNQKPYEKEIIRIEHSLTDKALNGPIVRLSLINNVAHAVEDLLKRGVTTITAIGSDQLFSKLSDQIAEQEGITIGLIPLGSHQQLAQLFGIPSGAEACKTLAARLVRPVQLCKINSAYFIHNVSVYDARAKVTVDKQFVLSPTSKEATISVFNHIRTDKETGEDTKTLSVVITPHTDKKVFKKSEALSPTSLLSPEVFISEPRGIPVTVDGQKIINTPVTLRVSDKSVQVIMGRTRKL